MPLDLKKLEKLVDLVDGIMRARCPACAENGQDKKGEHLRIYPDGRFGCCVFPSDQEHRKQIFALAGERSRQNIKVRVVAPKADGPLHSGILGRLGRLFPSPAKNLDAPDGSAEVETMSTEAGTLGTGCANSNRSFSINGELPLDELGTPGTPLEKPRVYIEKTPSVEGVHVSTHKGFRMGVPSVPEGEAAEQPPKTAEKQERMPFITPGGTLVIPFDSPERFHWWKGGHSVSATRAEVLARMASASQSGETPKADGGQADKEAQDQTCVEATPGRLNPEHGDAHSYPNGEKDRQNEQTDGAKAF